MPDGERIEDLGINFRRMTRVLLERHIEPHMPAITAAFDAIRRAVAAAVEQQLARLVPPPVTASSMAPAVVKAGVSPDRLLPDSNEAGSNLLTRFGQIVYVFCVVAPPAALVERAWNRGLAVGRYAVDDTLAHSVEAYGGGPQLFFTWFQHSDKNGCILNSSTTAWVRGGAT